MVTSLPLPAPVRPAPLLLAPVPFCLLALSFLPVPACSGTCRLCLLPLPLSHLSPLVCRPMVTSLPFPAPVRPASLLLAPVPFCLLALSFLPVPACSGTCRLCLLPLPRLSPLASSCTAVPFLPAPACAFLRLSSPASSCRLCPRLPSLLCRAHQAPFYARELLKIIAVSENAPGAHRDVPRAGGCSTVAVPARPETGPWFGEGSGKGLATR